MFLPFSRNFISFARSLYPQLLSLSFYITHQRATFLFQLGQICYELNHEKLSLTVSS